MGRIISGKQNFDTIQLIENRLRLLVGARLRRKEKILKAKATMDKLKKRLEIWKVG